MATQLFKNFPDIQYTLDSGKVITIKDFFRKSKIEQSAVNDIIDYEYVELQEGDRPDVVATKLYGDSDLHWTFFLVNNWNNYYEWWKNNSEFEQYLNRYYSGQYLTAHSKTDIVGATNKFLLGETVSCIRNNVKIEGVVNEVQPNFARIGVESGSFLGGEVVTGDVSGHSLTIKDGIKKLDGTAYYYNGNHKSNVFVNGMYEKTIYDHEWELNEAKRNIKAIRPEYVRIVVREFNRVMSA